MKVLVAGGRNYNLYSVVEDKLLQIHWETPIIEIIEGGARGADTLGGKWADENKVKRTTVKADWDKFGKSAGYKRNVQMAELEPDLVVLFPGGTGTQHMFNIATQRGLKILDYRNE